MVPVKGSVHARPIIERSNPRSLSRALVAAVQGLTLIFGCLARVGLVILPNESLVDYADFLVSKELTVRRSVVSSGDRHHRTPPFMKEPRPHTIA